MADFRNIHTRIWTDAWFCELEPDEKLLFIYLFSNPNASVCGMYELPKRNIAIDTGISPDRIDQILGSFEKSEKVFYGDGVVWVVNLKKYNDSGDSVKIQERVRKDLLAIQSCRVKERYCAYHKIPYSENEIPHTSETERDNTRHNDTDDKLSLPELYSKYIGEIPGMYVADEIALYEKECKHEYLAPAFKEIVGKKGIRNKWQYVKAILDDWRVNGMKKPGEKKPEPTNVIGVEECLRMEKVNAERYANV